ncbi:uncharacterized protein BDZ99DRAFT_431967 [Mytilinidion resinicola]|uniref:TMEM205-like domain-containing protein n=1 Tax=Mytilinidion resinicola TaxID=574789 RepID=A0A6A6Z984_9PEZI|nr:uncharacterized protein BDZ99DRAFT_431967 [Mytilinidion resinicola]KAF2817681.1 hypothetical protein BDZ99DRAFT_431967 [Mytilinidion resinicola]
MSSLSAFTKPEPYHLLSYGTLLGSTLFQSFVGGIIAFRVLPRPQFSVLQSHIFPVYFTMQTALPVVLALTYSGGPKLLTQQTLPASLIGTMIVTGVINWVWIGPETTKCMKERKHQETRDGKKSYDAGPHSAEMQRLNKRFGTLHGVSSLLNLAAFISTIWYGFVLGERL